MNRRFQSEEKVHLVAHLSADPVQSPAPSFFKDAFPGLYGKPVSTELHQETSPSLSPPAAYSSLCCTPRRNSDCSSAEVSLAATTPSSNNSRAFSATFYHTPMSTHCPLGNYVPTAMATDDSVYTFTADGPPRYRQPHPSPPVETPSCNSLAPRSILLWPSQMLPYAPSSSLHHQLHHVPTGHQQFYQLDPYVHFDHEQLPMPPTLQESMAGMTLSSEIGSKWGTGNEPVDFNIKVVPEAIHPDGLPIPIATTPERELFYGIKPDIQGPSATVSNTPAIGRRAREPQPLRRTRSRLVKNDRARVAKAPKLKHLCEYPGCDKKYQRPEHLKRHVDTTHNLDLKQREACRFCPKMFSRWDNYMAHLKLHAERDHSRTKYDNTAAEFVTTLRASMGTRRTRRKTARS